MTGFKGSYSGKTLANRGKGEERRFEMEQEIRFKAESRRSRMLGRWLAGKFKMSADEAEAYEMQVLHADLHRPGAEDVIDKVMHDIKARHAKITEKEVRKELEHLYAVAYEQITNENKKKKA
ncbi:MAG: hypothetical protein A3B62_00440 [Rhodospirillales bacterium RIFCSPLOWO2_01_FULL_65_14]|nr:MAG: hypothetical protein A3B62_00440 [Rhodospirillales bacterium RIFCSPLOWO2_01_FULL_65_14]